PLGAYLADRTTSRHRYGLWIYVPARLLWLILVLGIGVASVQPTHPHLLVQGALAIVVLTHFLGALGGASWFSWVAALVPRQLRGRYFGIRNSAISLTNLISVPLVGLAVTAWPGGSIQGYGVLLFLGVIVGLISIGFQYWMVDVNPQAQQQGHQESSAQNVNDGAATTTSEVSSRGFWQDKNFLMFLLYFALWGFSVNLSAPFFNIYLLDTLSLDVNWVTTYTSLGAGANLLMLVLWGRLADRIGNRPILVLVGLLVAVTPLLWLGTGTDLMSLLLWFPLLHILAGGTWAAIDLCMNNIQLGVAPVQHHATYFAIAGAVAGVSGALGTTAGGFLIEYTNSGGILGLFALSSVIRLVAILPLLLVREQRPRSVRRAVQVLAQGLGNVLSLPKRSPLVFSPQSVALKVPVEVTSLKDQAQ
ncbi:MAG TPA: MFS transporter, partial [Allocoleopsis sp.]